MRLTTGNANTGAQLQLGGANAGIFIDADADANVTFGTNARGSLRINSGATFSEAGIGIDIQHNGSGELRINRDLNAQDIANTSLKKSGTGTLTLAGNNKCASNFYLSEGRVNFNTGSAAGDPASPGWWQMA